MTVALLLAAAPDRLSAMAQPYRRPGDRTPGGSAGIDGVGGRLMSAGVRQVEVAMCAGAADGLRAVAAVARGAGEPVLVCTAARALATPGPALAAMLEGVRSAAVTASGTLFIARQDLPEVADAAEALAERIDLGDRPDGSRPPRPLSVRRIHHKTRVSGELNSAVLSLIDCVAGSGVRLASLAAKDVADVGHAADPADPAAGPATRRPGSRASQDPPGLVAALAVAPLAGRLARWAAARGLAPNAFTITALALALCAAAWFAAGSRSGLIAGAALLCVALPVRQARARLPAGSPVTTPFGGWLYAMSGPTAEYAVYAGLAVAGAAGAAGKPRQAWELATAAVIVLAVRQMTDACYASVAGPRPQAPGHRYRLLRLAGQSIALPHGERAVLIAITAPVWGPRMALAVLAGWGVVALGYSLAERAVAGRVPVALRDGGDGGQAARSGAR